MIKKALIFGVSGQDGSLLARFLLKKKYKVTGVSRNESLQKFSNLKRLQIYDNISLSKIDYSKYNQIYSLIKKNKCNEIYLLSDQSSVFKSLKIPHATIRDNLIFITNILEACKNIKKKIRIYYSSSSEIFGDINKKACDENSEFYPKSPYALSKLISFKIIKSYRENFKMWAASGIIFNHESFLRPNTFVLKKIIDFVKNCSYKSNKTIRMGNINISRDWGSAEDYVQYMWKMLQLKKPEDFVIATGKTVKLKKIINFIFKKKNLSIHKNIKITKSLIRNNELMKISGNIRKAKKKLKLKKIKNVFDVVEDIYKYNN